MSETGTLAAGLQSVFDALISSLFTCLPGRIESYDYSTRKATVKPLIKKTLLDETVEELPVITEVPVVFPMSKLSGMSFPLNRGDGVLLVFSQRSLERWANTGEDSEPGDPRKYDMTDAIAVVGLFSFKQNNLASNNDDLEIHHKGQKITLKSNGDIEIGNGTLEKLVTEIMFSKFNDHTHLYIPGPGTGTIVSGTPVTALSAPIVLGDSELTSKVKAS